MTGLRKNNFTASDLLREEEVTDVLCRNYSLTLENHLSKHRDIYSPIDVILVNKFGERIGVEIRDRSNSILDRSDWGFGKSKTRRALWLADKMQLDHVLLVFRWTKDPEKFIGIIDMKRIALVSVRDDLFTENNEDSWAIPTEEFSIREIS